MKIIYLESILILIALICTALVDASGPVEIRGPVDQVRDGHQYIISASRFSGANIFTGFYYDIDDDLGTESLILNIKGDSLGGDYRSPGIVYDSFAKSKPFEFEDWGSYNVIGFLAEKYFAGYINADDKNDILFEESKDENVFDDEQLLEVLIDDDTERTVSSGIPLKLKNGYDVIIKSIDVEGNKVYLDLVKNGATIDSKIITPSSEGAAMADKTYYYKADVGGTKGLVVVAIHFKNAFRSPEYNLATIDGVFQLSDEGRSVKRDMKYGVMRVSEIDPSLMRIKMDNKDNSIKLIRNKDAVLMEGLRIRVADPPEIKDAEPLRFYVYKELTKPGVYEIRGEAEDMRIGTEYSYDTNNFSGFYYDLDNNIGTETMKISILGNSQNWRSNYLDVTYRTDVHRVPFNFTGWGEYYAIGFQGEKYFVGYAKDPSEPKVDTNKFYVSEDIAENLMDYDYISKVLIDSDEERVLAMGSSIPLEDGYEIRINDLNVNGGRLVLSLFKDDVEKDGNHVVEIGGPEMPSYYYSERLGGMKVIVIALNFSNDFSDPGANLVTLNGLWQISDQPEVINKGDEIDNMTIIEVNSAEGKQYIVMRNKDHHLELGDDETILIMKNFHIKTADQEVTPANPLRFFIYREATIDEMVEANFPAANSPPLKIETPPKAPESEADSRITVEKESQDVQEKMQKTPGFEALVAVSVLLAISSFITRGIRRNKGLSTEDSKGRCQADDCMEVEAKTPKSLLALVLLITVMPSYAEAKEIMPLSSSDSVDELVNEGDIFFAEGKYNESIESYDGAIELLESEKESIGAKSDDILINLYKISQEYDLSENIIEQNDQKCNDLRNPINIIGDLASMAFFIYVQLPFEIFPKPYSNTLKFYEGLEETSNNIVIAGDIFSRTFNCLKWEAGQRNKYEDSIKDLRGKSQNLQASYNQYQEHYKITSDQLKKILNRKCEALSKLNNTEDYNLTKERITEMTKNDESISWHNQGFIFGVNGDYENAMKYFDEAIRNYPRDADAWFGKGFVLYRQGKFNEAIKAYDEAIRIDPVNAMAWNNRGLALVNLGMYDDAIECFDTAAGIFPQSADIWYNKGVALEKSKRSSEANDAFDKAKGLAHIANG